MFRFHLTSDTHKLRRPTPVIAHLGNARISLQCSGKWLLASPCTPPMTECPLLPKDALFFEGGTLTLTTFFFLSGPHLSLFSMLVPFATPLKLHINIIQLTFHFYTILEGSAPHAPKPPLSVRSQKAFPEKGQTETTLSFQVILVNSL